MGRGGGRAGEGDGASFADLVARLCRRSREGYYNPYTTFDWPDSLPDERPWMSPELLSVAGTDVAGELSPDQLVALSRWESVNFYSLNVAGIRELLLEVTRRIHAPGFEVASEFFHDFVGEENEHMWFFAMFCRRYGGKLYADKRMKLGDAPTPALDNFLVFARILVFEQLVDHYNVRMAADDRLPPIVREINRVHHRDEARHIAFGARLVRLLWHEALDAGLDDDARRATADYLIRYATASVESLYNPSAYRDAGIADGFALRRRLLRDPARQAVHADLLRRPVDLLTAIGAVPAAGGP